MPAHSPPGFILIAVLWVAMLLSVFALNYATTSRLSAERVRGGEQLAEQAHVLRSALALAEHRVRTYQANRERLEEMAEAPDEEMAMAAREHLFPPLYEPYELEVDGRRVQVHVVSETGKWNVNALSEPMLERILAACGVEFGAATTALVNGILDWIDEDDLRRMEGAETQQYMALEHPYPAKNGPLESIEELLLVQGVDADLFLGVGERPGLIDFLTVSGQGERLDINSASPRALALVPDIQPETIEGVLQLRQAGRIEQMADLAAYVDPRDYEQLVQYFDVLDPGIITLEARITDPETGRAGRVLKKRLE